METIANARDSFNSQNLHLSEFYRITLYILSFLTCIYPQFLFAIIRNLNKYF